MQLFAFDYLHSVVLKCHCNRRPLSKHSRHVSTFNSDAAPVSRGNVVVELRSTSEPVTTESKHTHHTRTLNTLEITVKNGCKESSEQSGHDLVRI